LKLDVIVEVALTHVVAWVLSSKAVEVNVLEVMLLKDLTGLVEDGLNLFV